MSRWDRPNYEDVRWDHGAAAAATAALRHAATELEQAASDGERLAGAATRFWMGGHALTFAMRRRLLSTEARDLAADCRAAAAAVGAADERARAEQARREREREEWERRERERRDNAQPRL
jgi:hypothetical protein